MKNFLLGVNGGAGKTEFLLTDRLEKKVYSFTIDKGTNPWHCGIEQTKNVLRDGFSKLKQEYIDNTEFAYLGISGCFGDSKYNSQIEAFVSKIFPKFKLAGDLYSSFRALSRNKYGLIAIAGSGSSIASFSSRGTYFFDGPAFGGRDFGYMLVKQLISGHLETKAYLKGFIVQQIAPCMISGSGKISEWSKEPKVLNLSSSFNSLRANEETFKEAKAYLDLVIDRWVYKICSYVTKYKNDLDEAHELVLSGGFWKFTYIRKSVIEGIQENIPEVSVLYSENAKPVIGCIRIAGEMTKNR
ncbi:MAG: hypothetical protein ABIE03_07535 [Patescibacteria group bacterium]|nr:hypothetical protein [Patescibacteria group bacterium]